MTSPVTPNKDKIVLIETGLENTRERKQALLKWEPDGKGGFEKAFYELDGKYRMYTINAVIIE